MPRVGGRRTGGLATDLATFRRVPPRRPVAGAGVLFDLGGMITVYFQLHARGTKARRVDGWPVAMATGGRGDVAACVYGRNRSGVVPADPGSPSAGSARGRAAQGG